LRTRPVLFEINLHRHLRLLFAEQWKELISRNSWADASIRKLAFPLSSSIRRNFCHIVEERDQALFSLGYGHSFTLRFRATRRWRFKQH
jgi:hypothetical protein